MEIRVNTEFTLKIERMQEGKRMRRIVQFESL